MNILMNKIPYVNPRLKTPLEKHDCFYEDKETGERFLIEKEIPRFCPSSNYSQTFGYQWKIFSKTQIDPHSGNDASEQRFFATTDWSTMDISESKILEVGSGAGRFTEVLMRTGNPILYSVDSSNAIDTNYVNNSIYLDRLTFAQADIYALPFPKNSFDKVLCLGVLQHTPDVRRAIESLVHVARDDGVIVVDFYPMKGWYTRVHAKYIVRPLTKRLPRKILLTLIARNISWLIFVFDTLVKVKLGFLTRMIPIADLRYFPKKLNESQRREWAIMDTFDALSPMYDRPQNVKTMIRYFEENSCEVIFSGEVEFGTGRATVIRARKIERSYSHKT